MWYAGKTQLTCDWRKGGWVVAMRLMLARLLISLKEMRTRSKDILLVICYHETQARLGRSLKRLAEDLYSKETHFVLELIQNADDNKYEEGVKPALEFHVDSDRILVNNNEMGFTKEDVRVWSCPKSQYRNIKFLKLQYRNT